MECFNIIILSFDDFFSLLVIIFSSFSCRQYANNTNTPKTPISLSQRFLPLAMESFHSRGGAGAVRQRLLVHCLQTIGEADDGQIYDAYIEQYESR
jgi:hypothetical protein